VVVVAMAGTAPAITTAVVVGCMGEGTTLPQLAILADAEAGAPPAWLRLANLSPTAPNVDFCLSPITAAGQGTFTGPLLAQLSSRLSAAGTPVAANMGGSGLAFTQVSAYVQVASLQQFTVRVVAGNAGSCGAGIVNDLTVLPMATGEFETIALLGEEVPTPTLEPFARVDDPSVDGGFSASKAYLRFFHAAPGQPPVDVSINGGRKRLFLDVPFGEVSAPPIDPSDLDGGVPVDNNGYWVTAALSTQPNDLAVQTSGEGGVVLARATIDVAAGGIVTVALVGDSPTDEAGPMPTNFQIMQCVDNGATTAMTILANCTAPLAPTM
jgi:hypothetical protein